MKRIKELTTLPSTPLSPFRLTLSPDPSSTMSSPTQLTNNEENPNEVTIPLFYSPKQDEEITIDSLLSKKKSPVEKYTFFLNSINLIQCQKCSFHV
jgi:hypothetical protein